MCAVCDWCAPGTLCGLQARLPEIEELQKQLTATQAEATEAAFKAQEEAAAAATREATLTGEAAWQTWVGWVVRPVWRTCASLWMCLRPWAMPAFIGSTSWQLLHTSTLAHRSRGGGAAAAHR